VLLTLLAGMVGTLAGLVEARRQRDSAEAVSRFLLDDVFARQEWDVYGPEMTGSTSLEQLLDRTTAAVTRAFPGDPAAAAAVQQAVGDLYYTVDLAKSEARLRDAHEARVRLSGKDSPDAWKAAHRLAYTLAHRGLTGEALRLALPAEAGLRRTLGPDDPEALQASEALAAIFLALGQWDDGLSRLERVREASWKRHGPDHVATLRSSFHLGEGYARAGRWADAVAVLEPLVDARRRVSGPDETATVYAVDVLAIAYENTGRLDAAESLRRQSLTVREAKAPGQWTTPYARVLLGDLLPVGTGRTKQCRSFGTATRA
jgi:tetratricopeptide (TPR) repeat protein